MINYPINSEMFQLSQKLLFKTYQLIENIKKKT